MRISDWSSDVCSSDLLEQMNKGAEFLRQITDFASFCKSHAGSGTTLCTLARAEWIETTDGLTFHISANRFLRNMVRAVVGTLLERSEEHTSGLQSLMRISYAVFCLKKNKNITL